MRAPWLLAVPFLIHASTDAATNYSARRLTEDGVSIVRLSDAARGVEVSITPSLGNRAYEFKVHGKNILYFPFADAAAFAKDGGQSFCGIPFLAPWANRMAGAGFWANDKHYMFNPELGSVRVAKNGIAIHGMLSASPRWEVTAVQADRKAAWVTSRFLFWKYPELMANWPFAEEYEMTYRLSNGVLEVTTTIVNRSAEAMPVAIGFHPYFQIPGAPRAAAHVHIPAEKHVETDQNLVATGVLKPIQPLERISLKDRTFDDGFTGLKRDGDGKARLFVENGDRKITVVYGAKFPVAVVYAPPGKEFVCFEPMTAITNGVNLAHEGKYATLQSVAPGASWRESFWVEPSGF
ncbi:MAG TPA: aldose 1-epimerase [Bryobacteraceae bacterium]|jgi:aldose 1-epimerase|nr:aldose 1-epimerase [Bryobacteraceae bacterium]